MAARRRPTAKQIDRYFAVYRALMDSGLREMGAQATGEKYGYQYLLETKHGPLRVNIHGGEKYLNGPASDLGGLHTRFNEVDRLPVSANPHSGKWNHYFEMSDGPPEVMAAQMLGLLRSVAASPRRAASMRRRSADLGPQAITRPSGRAGLYDVVIVDSHGIVKDVLHRNVPYSRAVSLIRSRPL